MLPSSGWVSLVGASLFVSRISQICFLIQEMQNSHEKVLAEEIRARDAQLQTALEELHVSLLVGCTPSTALLDGVGL